MQKIKLKNRGVWRYKDNKGDRKKMKKITIWSKKENIKNDQGDIIKIMYNHNHIENG